MNNGNLTSSSKENLSSIFSGGGSKNEGNDALRYVAPKEPSRRASGSNSSNAASSQSNSAASSIIHGVSVYLYKFDQASNSYQQMSQTALGSVIVGSGTAYRLLFYDSNKTHICDVHITPHFKCTIQKNNYVNFYDQNKVYWSVRFGNEADVYAFMKVISLTQVHSGIWGQPQHSSNKVHKYDLSLGKEGSDCAVGDKAGISLTAWKVVGSPTSKPTDIVRHNPFEQTGSSDIRKIILGDFQDPIAGLTEGVIGMKKGGSRLLLVPPGVTRTTDWILIIVSLERLKSMNKKSHSPSNTSNATISNLKESDDIRSRMAHLSRAGSSRGSHSGLLAEVSGNQIHSSQDDKSGNSTHSIVPYEKASEDLRAKKELLQQEQEELQNKARALEEARNKFHIEQMAAKDAELEREKRRWLELQHQPQQLPQNIHANPSTNSGFGSTTVSQNTTPGVFGVQNSSPYPYGNTTASAAGRLDILQASTHNSTTSANFDGINRIVRSTSSMEVAVSEISMKLDRLLYIANSSRSADSSPLKYGNPMFGNPGPYGSSIAFGGAYDGMQPTSLIKGIERLLEEHERLSKEVSDRRAQVGELESKVEELLGKNHQIMLQNSRLNEHSNNSRQQHTIFSSQLAMAQSAKESAEAQVSRLQMEIGQLKQSYEQARQSENENTQQREYERQVKERLEEALNIETQGRTLAEKQLKLLEEQSKREKADLESEWEQKLLVEKQMTERTLNRMTERRVQEKQEVELKVPKLEADLEESRKFVHRLQTEGRDHIKQMQSSMAESKERTRMAEERAKELLFELDDIKNNHIAQMEQTKADHEAAIAMIREQFNKEKAEALETARSEGHIQGMKEAESMVSNGPRNEDISSNEELNQIMEELDAARTRIKEAERRGEVAEQMVETLNQEQDTAKEELKMLTDRIQILTKELEAANNSKIEPSCTSAPDVIEVFKQLMNQIYFEFQDLLQEDQEYNGKEVIDLIRKVLKQSTKDSLARLEHTSIEDSDKADDSAE